MEKMLEGKAAIITGSGRGIGQAAARLFSQEGENELQNREKRTVKKENRRMSNSCLNHCLAPGHLGRA